MLTEKQKKHLKMHNMLNLEAYWLQKSTLEFAPDGQVQEYEATVATELPKLYR